MNRRRFFRWATGATLATPLAGACYGFWEAANVAVVRRTVSVPRLPAGFRNTQVAFLTDIHNGPYLTEDFVVAVVRTTQLLRPDLIALGGDYSLQSGSYIGPCFDVLSALSAPLGVYAVLGNHDTWHGRRATQDGMRSAKITELTNRGAWLERRGDRLLLAGVDDLWTGRPDLPAALGDAPPSVACVLLCHNPDFAETLTDRRVGLVLSGHTHGGQIVLPGAGSPWVPSRYGQKYAHGLVEAPATRVYVSAGIGMTAVPMRVGRRPEITLLTLV